MADFESDFLCDVNVLVALVHDAHEHSTVANAWLEAVHRSGGVRVCRVVQLGFLRLITSTRIFAEHALSPPEAWQAYEETLRDHRFSAVGEQEGFDAHFRAQSVALPPGATIGTDVYLAAFARASGLEVVTFDSGFRRFREVRVRVLAADRRG